MTWFDLRNQLPDRWVVVKALSAHTEEDRRLLHDVAVAGVFDSGTDAWLAVGARIDLERLIINGAEASE